MVTNCSTSRSSRGGASLLPTRLYGLYYATGFREKSGCLSFSATKWTVRFVSLSHEIGICDFEFFIFRKYERFIGVDYKR